MNSRRQAACCWWLAAFIGCGGGPPSSPQLVTSPDSAARLTIDAGPIDLPGVPHVCRVSEGLFSGGLPVGDEGFASLQKLGVRTVISVDGARPDVERARQFSLRYVHLPIGYDGVSREQGLRLARAVRDLPGPVFLHCHHGKHRSPAAAAAVRLCLDGTCTADAALAFLQQAGTGENYRGLYQVPRQFTAVATAELDRVPNDFPEISQVDDLVALMVLAEKRYDHLQLLHTADWRPPPAHPDLDPAHEALLLREVFAEMARLPELASRPEEFRRGLSAAAAEAGRLEDALRAAPGRDSVDADRSALLKRCGQSCTQCHAKYRDLPRE